MAFPNPPIFAKYYTERAISRKRCPPPPPVPKQFVIFGEHYDMEEPIIKSLPEMGQVQVFKVPKTMDEFKAELKRLNSSIMAMFLDLIQLLINNTGSKHRHEAFENLRVLFINMHHLVNECRTAQGFASLVVMQNERIKQLRELTTDFQITRANIENLLGEAQKCSVGIEIPFDLEKLRRAHKAAQKSSKSIQDAFDTKLSSQYRPVAVLKDGDISEMLELRKAIRNLSVNNSNTQPHFLQ